MDKKQLKKTARLARLKLSKNEEREFTQQLFTIFEYFNQISSVDTQGVEPLSYPLEGLVSEPHLREDLHQEVQNKEELLKLAPDRMGDEYKVPPVVE